MLKRLNKILFILNVTIATFLISTTITSLFKYTQFKKQEVDVELKPYVNEYYNILNVFCENKNYNHSDFYSIKLVDEMRDKKWLGVCEWKLNGYSISIKRSWWEANDESNRRQMVYHEMAHCLIDRDHEENNTEHYMYTHFYPLNEQVFVNQAIKDVSEHCK